MSPVKNGRNDVVAGSSFIRRIFKRVLSAE
jgi:hypothetical protein